MRRAGFVCSVMVMLVVATATPSPAGEETACGTVRDAVLNARNVLRAYDTSKGEYPAQLSATTFNPPERVIVIYEKMDVKQPRDIYMVRAYGEGCSTMFLATPTTSDVFEVPLNAAKAKTAATAATHERAAVAEPPKNGAMIGALAAFFTVFFLIVLGFVFMRSSAAKPAADTKNEPETVERAE